MKEHPILFKGKMVRATLEDLKTHTRRVVKMSISTSDHGIPHNPMIGHKGLWYLPNEICPYGTPGDHLWVRETWRIIGWNEEGDWMIEYKDGVTKWFDSVEEIDEDTSVRWWEQCSDDCEKAKIPVDDSGVYVFDDEHPCPTRWRPSIFMPRWASRITLEIVNIRVEHVQDISQEDCIAEGLYQWSSDDNSTIYYGIDRPDVWEQDPRLTYKRLWNSINNKSGFGWDVNPWVWVIEFKRLP